MVRGIITHLMEVANSQIPPKQGDKAGPSNPTENAPGEKVWVDNVEAPARAKSLRRIL